MNRTKEQYNLEYRQIEDKWFDEWSAMGGSESGKRPDWYYRDEQEKLRKDWYKSLEVGDRVHINHYTDVDPATIIKRTEKMIIVRVDKAELDGQWKPEFIPGGFSAHCTNDSEQINHWVIEEDETGSTERFNWSEKYGVWKNKSNETVSPGWLKYYDYNF
ncbi:MAG: hypothetical protein IJH65_03910 [Methanobrevibacter sp.]|nr:hypothetical protein [Methanobrevibacter sp.]